MASESDVEPVPGQGPTPTSSASGRRAGPGPSLDLSRFVKTSTAASSDSLTRMAADLVRVSGGIQASLSSLDNLADWAAQATNQWQTMWRRIGKAITEAGVQLGVAVELARPDNWKPGYLELGDVEKIEQLAIGWSLPLIWAPRGEIGAELVAIEGASVPTLLKDRADDILDDVEAVLDEISEPTLATWLTLGRDAIDAARSGKWRAGQMLAVGAAGGALEFAFGISRSRLPRRQPSVLEITIHDLRRVLLLSGVATAWEHRGDRDPVPTRLHRHSTMHAPSLAQYSTSNCLTALMLVAGVLRELDPPVDRL